MLKAKYLVIPTDILQRILDLMPIKYLALASILSKSWMQLQSTLYFFQFISYIEDFASSIFHESLKSWCLALTLDTANNEKCVAS